MIKIWLVALFVTMSAGGVGWFAVARGIAEKPRGNTAASSNMPPGKPLGVSVSAATVKNVDIPIHLDGLGTVQAFESVVVRAQIEGQLTKIHFKEGQEIRQGDLLAEIDPRLFQAQLDQGRAKLKQDQAKVLQSRAKVEQDRANEKQNQAKKQQNQAAVKVAEAKKVQDSAQLENAKVNLKRYEDSLAAAAISEQTMLDQRALVAQYSAQVLGDEAAIAAANAAVLADEASLLGDIAAIKADEAAAASDEALVLADEAAIKYAETFLSYTKIKAPINGRIGFRLVDVGNIVRANDPNGIVVITQINPISVVFTLPQQDLAQINDRLIHGDMPVLAVESDGKTEFERGTLSVIDNQIDPATGTLKAKATFENAKRRLWPGGFVNIRLLVNTSKNALTIPAPAVQQGPDGTFVYVIKADQTVEVRKVKVALVQDGRSIIETGVAENESVVLTGHDRLKAGEKVIVGKPGEKPAENPGNKAETIPGRQPSEAGEKSPRRNNAGVEK